MSLQPFSWLSACLQLAVDGKELEEMNLELLPGAARRLMVQGRRPSRINRVPGDLRRVARHLLLQPDRVGVLRLRHVLEVTHCPLGEIVTVNDQAVLGVEPARAL